MAVEPVLLIVVDRREFALRCMGAWLSTFRREFVVTSVLEVDKSLRANEVARARAVIIGTATPSLPNPWLEKQVAWLFARRADMPIVAVTDIGEADAGETFAAALNLRGHISTSSTIDVAAAALRLVVAGGTYLPHEPKMQIGQRPAQVQLEQILEEKSVELLRTLTPRERGVLELLERGMANKAIAYRLNMSSSTVKVHVHNIMVKLNAHNRTEAAVAAARFVNLGITAIEAKSPSETALRLLLGAPSVPRAAPAKRSLATPIDDRLPSLLPIEPSRSVEDSK